ncbi:MAG TPA: AarF/ABC1/UbiB kinase family protein [Planctomycetota bacterium]|nr:AarF/ABC1/UbiB kinase family protein [Planctomycetota bacterium]
MRILELVRTYRSLRRLKDIVVVLSRHGFGGLVDRLHLSSYAPLLSRLLRTTEVEPHEPMPAPERLVLALQELGPTFVKFGQLLATRPDLIPEAYVEALSALQDRVAPFDSGAARGIIERELKRPIAEVFRSFQDQPAASGSLAQVHFAELPDGRAVALKVKRPGAEKTFLADLDLLASLAELAERHVPELARFQPRLIVEEFGRALRREINFTTEAATMVKFAGFFGADSPVRVPEVHWELSGPDLLIMERLDGLRLSDIPGLRRAGLDTRKLAHTLGQAFLRQYFEFGIFHADPHPGNILALDGGRVGLLDFGAVGHMSPELKSQLATTLTALVRGDLDLIISVYTDMGVFSDSADLASIRLDLIEMLDRYYGLPASKVDLGSVFSDLVRLARRHDVQLPRDFVMLGRSFVLMSGLLRQLDPELNMAEAVKPYAERLLIERLDPRHLLKRAGANLYYLGSFLHALPRDLRMLMKKAQAGRLTMTFRHEGLEHLTRELDRSSNRLAFALIIAAVIVGSSLLLAKEVKPLILYGNLNLSILGLVGYVFAGFMGLGLAWSIYRSGKL